VSAHDASRRRQHLFGYRGRLDAVPCDHTGILGELIANHVRVGVGRISPAPFGSADELSGRRLEPKSDEWHTGRPCHLLDRLSIGGPTGDDVGNGGVTAPHDEACIVDDRAIHPPRCLRGVSLRTETREGIHPAQTLPITPCFRVASSPVIYWTAVRWLWRGGAGVASVTGPAA
jgi:hypothetical protein